MKLLLALLLLLTCAQPTREKEPRFAARARRTVQVERWGILWTVEVEE